MTFREKFILWRRYMAFLIDALITMVIVLLVCDLILDKIFGVNERSIIWTWGCTVFLLLIIRDIFGRSLGKRIFGFKIISYNEHENPKIHQLIVRNISLLLLPIEIIFVIVEKDHLRLGDYIAETQVIPKEGGTSK